MGKVQKPCLIVLKQCSQNVSKSLATHSKKSFFSKRGSSKKIRFVLNHAIMKVKYDSLREKAPTKYQSTNWLFATSERGKVQKPCFSD
jgi:hypothetical protein